MAVNKTLVSTSLVLDVQAGTDTLGNPVYRKRTFNGIKEDATPQSTLDVALKINEVLAGGVRDISLSESHRLVQA